MQECSCSTTGLERFNAGMVNIVDRAGRILLGGSWSSYRQKFPLWVTVSFVVVGIMAILAGFLTVPAVE